MNKKGLLHGLMMLVCCLVPMLALVLFLPQIKSISPSFNWSWLLMLMCPLMHILMMKGMHGKGESCHSSGKEAKGAKGEE